MKSIALVGAGNIGSTVAALLGAAGDYRVTVLDASPAALARIQTGPRVRVQTLDAADPTALRAALAGQFAVLSAAPFYLTTAVAEAAVMEKVHYLDLTEDVASTRHIKQLAAGAQSALIAQCGLAPGFVSIVAAELCRRFDSLHSVRMRVGALPQFPSNALNYNLTWSTDGVINEYCEPCEAIVDGQMRQVPPLAEHEEFSLDGVTYEAFNTSGGPATLQDVVIVFVTVSGLRGGRLMQETYAHKVYSQPLGGTPHSAIQLTTAASLCAVLDLLASGKLPARGFVRQEDIALSDFLANRFGAMYADGPATLAPASLPWGDARQSLSPAHEDFKGLMPLAHA